MQGRRERMSGRLGKESEKATSLFSVQIGRSYLKDRDGKDNEERA